VAFTAVLTAFTGVAGSVFASFFAALFTAFLTFAQRASCARATLFLPSALMTRLITFGDVHDEELLVTVETTAGHDRGVWNGCLQGWAPGG
jgi:hypothetical protein